MIDTHASSSPSATTQDHPKTDEFRILLVEDDADLRYALADYLRFEGYHVEACRDGDEAISCVFDGKPFDVLLLDVMLPGRSGFEVLDTVRSAGLSVPTVMLTAKGDQEDILNGFDLGADDYVPKPFSADVLVARVRAILSRAKSPAERPMDIHEFGEIKVNFSSNEVFRNERPISFTALEFDLLRYLINNRNKVVSREQLLRNVWNLPPDIDTRTVDRHVASLRKKIEPKRDDPRHIITVYGRGYRFEP